MSQKKVIVVKNLRFFFYFFADSIFISYYYPFSNKFYRMLLWLGAFPPRPLCVVRWTLTRMYARVCQPISFAFFSFFFALPSLWSGWYHCELITRRHYQYCFSFVKKLSQYWKICLHKLPNICTFFLSPFNFFFFFFLLHLFP